MAERDGDQQESPALEEASAVADTGADLGAGAGTDADPAIEPEKPAFVIPARRMVGIALFVIAVDQISKWLVLKNMYKHQSIDLIGDWLKFTFTENPGMAFGIEYGYPGLITIVSILATVLILVYTIKVRTIYAPYSTSLAFVLGGALGNIIDRVFYGAILYDEPLFLGKVVDFIHVNVWRGTVSESVPFFGGKFMALFPIWNVADMAIVLGVVGILFYQKRFHDRADELHEAKVKAREAESSADGPGSDATTSPSPPA